MKAALLSAAALLMAATTTANAGLAECRAIENDSARLNCYDNLSATEQRMSEAINPVQSGWYAGVSAGLSTSHSIPAPYGDLKLSSGYAGGVVGFNAFHGQILTGVELDVRTGLEKQSQTSTPRIWETTLPALSATAYGWPHGREVGSVERRYQDGGSILSDRRSIYTMRERVSPTLSARFGYAHDNWLIYGRIGGGASLIKETVTDDDSRSIRCSKMAIDIHYTTPTRWEEYYVDCVSPYSGPTFSKSNSKWIPTATIAAGLEYHFYNYFVRGEAELKHLFVDNSLPLSNLSGATKYQFGTTLGVRF